MHNKKTKRLFKKAFRFIIRVTVFILFIYISLIILKILGTILYNLLEFVLSGDIFKGIFEPL